MGAKTLKPGTASLYDEDFAVWTSEPARLLREKRFDEIDIEHVAEEIEDMGKRDKRELYSRLTVLTIHLLKWKWQPEKRPESWRSTIATQRTEIPLVLEDSPSLRRATSTALTEIYGRAVKAAIAQTALPAKTFPRECPFSPQQLLDFSFLPD